MRNLFRLILQSNHFYITEKIQKLFFWRKPIKPYAFIRVHNEIQTIEASLYSILNCVKGGVIGFHSCTDGTKEYILEFCKKYPQFSAVEYPFDIIPADDVRYKSEDIDERMRLDSYYNFVWSHLPKNEWIIKIDADHFYIPEYLNMLCRLPIFKSCVVYLNRMNLHYEQGQLFIRKDAPFFEGGDHWIIYNHKDFYFELKKGYIGDKFFAWESLVFRKKYVIFGILCNYHFPILKKWRNFNPVDWIPLDEFDFSKYFREHNMKGRVPEKMLDKKFILECVQKFNLE